MSNPFISLRPLSKVNSVRDGVSLSPESFARWEAEAQQMANEWQEDVEMRSAQGVTIFEPQ